MNVVVDGLMTNYQKTGHGKVLVFLHGWGDSMKVFSKLIESLRSDYTILVLDLPGFGGTQAPERAWDLADYSKFVAAWLNKIDAGKVYAVAGHSFGGAIAMKALAEGVVAADKLVLLASAGVRNKRGVRKRLLKITAKAAKVPLYALPASRRQDLKRKLYNAAGSDALLVPSMESTYRRMISEDIVATASKIEIPTLLVYGAKDPDTPVADGKLLQKAIKNSTLEIIDAGHQSPREEPEQIVKLISDFLQDKS